MVKNLTVTNITSLNFSAKEKKNESWKNSQESVLLILKL